MFTCKCGKEYGENKNGFGQHKAKCPIYQKYIESVLCKEFFDSYSDVPLFSLTRDVLKNEFSYATVVKHAAEFGRTPMSIKDVSVNKYTREKYKTTCIEKYGCDHPSKNEDTKNKQSRSHIKNKKTFDEIDVILTKEFFEKYKNTPMTYICETVLENKFSYYTVHNKAKALGIPMLSNSEAISNNITQEKMKATMLEKYGVENISQNEDIKKIKAETQTKNYGSAYTFCSDILYEKYKKTMVEKYGKDNPSKIQEFQNKKMETCFKNHGKYNIFCDHEYIKSFYIKYWDKTNPSQVEEFQKKKDETCIKNYGMKSIQYLSKYSTSNIAMNLFTSIYNEINEKLKLCTSFAPMTYEVLITNDANDYLLDFCIISGDKKLCIEFNGDFWHMNPAEYSSTDIHPILNCSASDIWEKDAIKKRIIKENKFELISIWESDYIEYKDMYKQMCLSVINEIFQG